MSRFIIALAFLLTTLSAAAFARRPNKPTKESEPQVLRVPSWDYIGPFPSGKMELDGDPIEEMGGIEKALANKKATYFSELVDGGRVGWTTLYPDGNGAVTLQFPAINWNKLIQGVGGTAVLEVQGWAAGTLNVVTAGRYSVACSGLHTIEVAGRLLAVDLFQTGTLSPTVYLSAGSHPVRIHVRAKVQATFSCSFLREEGLIRAHRPTIVPDIYNGHLASEFIAIPIEATGSTEDWIEIKGIETDSKIISASVERQVIAPGQTLPLPVRLSIRGERALPCPTEFGMRIQSVVKGSSQTLSATSAVSLRCRSLGQSFLFTHMDHDGTVSLAAGIAPYQTCPPGGCAIMLSLHGTGVSASNQADAHKHKKGSEMVFGYPDAWVLAPDRHGAHNWEYTGYFSAMNALEALTKLPWVTGDIAANANAVIYSGHSMGGHGCWQAATHQPDRAVGVIAGAGWITKEHYGDANAIFGLDVATPYTEPALIGVLETTVAEHGADFHAMHLKGVPVLARVGQEDNTVSPWYSRRMLRILEAAGSRDLTLSEIPKQAHWWWDTKTENDGGVVNDLDIRNYVARLNKDAVPAIPTSFTLTTFNPGTSHSRGGIRIVQQIRPFQRSTASFQERTASWEISTINVRRLLFTTVARVRNATSVPVEGVSVDGIKFSREEVAHLFADNLTSLPTKHLCRIAGSWTICSDPLDTPGAERSVASSGPARMAAAAPFMIVAGTKGTEEESTVALEGAVYVANVHYASTGTKALVIRDTDLTEDQASMHNLILLGGPTVNAWTSKLETSLPVSFRRNGGFMVGGCEFTSPGMGTIFTAPAYGSHPRTYRINLVVAGVDARGLRDMYRSWARPTIPPMNRAPYSNMIPDFIVADGRARARGVGAILAAGYWSNSWTYQSDVSYAPCAA